MTDSVVPRTHRWSITAASMVIGVCLAACSPPDSTVKDEPKFAATLSIQELMHWVLEPAAEVIWDSAGFVITREGERDLTPTTDEHWAQVMSAAATLAESGNLLMLPGRSPGADWEEYSRGLVNASRLGLEAALARDGKALFDAGGRIYQVCRACHNQYWVKGEAD